MHQLPNSIEKLSDYTDLDQQLLDTIASLDEAAYQQEQGKMGGVDTPLAKLSHALLAFAVGQKWTTTLNGAIAYCDQLGVSKVELDVSTPAAQLKLACQFFVPVKAAPTTDDQLIQTGQYGLIAAAASIVGAGMPGLSDNSPLITFYEAEAAVSAALYTNTSEWVSIIKAARSTCGLSD